MRLRNINFNGFDSGLIAIRIFGGVAGGAVLIEDCLIDGNFGGVAHGISDQRTGGGKLLVSNSIIRNTGGKGLTIDPGLGTGVNATLDNVRSQNKVQFGATFGKSVRVMINRSVFSGNGSGIVVQALLAASEVNINSSVISNNGIGVFNAGGAVTIQLSDNDISFNNTALSGATQFFRNNRIRGNGALGTDVTAIGSASNPTGLQ